MSRRLRRAAFPLLLATVAAGCRDADDDLLRAVAADDAAAVRRALADGADPNFVHEEQGWGMVRYDSPMHDAAGAARTEVLALLLDAGGDPHLRLPGPSLTPLHLAVWAGDGDGVRTLLAAGGLPDPPDGHTGWREDLLSMPANRCDPATLRLLLNAGAELLPGVGPTPAHWAARNGCGECLRLLVAAGFGPPPEVDERRPAPAAVPGAAPGEVPPPAAP